MRKIGSAPTLRPRESVAPTKMLPDDRKLPRHVLFPDPERCCDDNGVPQSVAADGNRREQGLQRIQVQQRYRKGDAYFQKIAEHAEACAKKHVADLCQDLAIAGVQTLRSQVLVNEQVAESYRTVIVQE